MKLPDTILISPKIEINIPIEWDFKEPLECVVKSKTKKANRFIRKLGRLCKRFGYLAEIELTSPEK